MQYEIVRGNRKTLAAQIKDGKLIVRAPLQISDEEIDRFVRRHRRWIETNLTRSQTAKTVRMLTPAELCTLAERAKRVIPERVAYYARLVGVTYGKITVRTQRSRWGSCSGRGNLNFNCLLMLAPPRVLDSVVVHELCHRKQMNHSDRFYAELLRVFPDYREQNEWLKENGARLLAMLPEK
ncbi:MAG: M48 family metallopeptidase [Oscillospiraceae bacterium]|nr:M48 family metallopeptidase [Oscillospiraceae bacterium]